MIHEIESRNVKYPLLFVMFSLFVVTLNVNLQVPLYSEYVSVGGYSIPFVAYIFSAYVIGIIPSFVFLGDMSAVFGCKNVMIASLCIMAVSNLMISLFPSVELLFLVRVLHGVAMALALGTAASYIHHFMLDSQRSADVHGIIVSIGLGGGGLLTMLLSENITLTNGIPHSYVLVLVMNIAGLVMMLRIAEPVVHRTVSKVSLPTVTYRGLGYCMLIFVAWSLNGVVLGAIPVKLSAIGYVDWVGWVVFLAIASGAIAQPISRRKTSNWSLSVGCVFLVISYCMLLAGVALDVVEFMLLGAFFSGLSGFGFIYTGGLSAIMDINKARQASAVSGYFMFAYLGLGVSSAAVGWLSNQFDVQWALMFFGILSFLTLLFVCFPLMIKAEAHSFKERCNG